MSEQRESSEPAPRAPEANAPRVHTLLICDLADSTALVERLGDAAAAELFRRHDRVARDLLQRFRGHEIDKTDGFLLLFERPVEAVGFALHYQRALRTLLDDARQPLRARVGIHVGEVVLWRNSRAEIDAGAKPVEVEGLAKPVVARLMALALPGQILLSGIAFSIAQRAEKELDGAAQLRWLTHGRYHFKGVPAPMLVHEVGEAGFAPLQAPPSSAKAARDVPLWRKPGMLTLEAIALLAAIAIPLALTLRAPPAIAFGERDWIVMGELRNLTGETLLDDSLETAFRISLEQSRHVNVLPDLKLRDALARMQRPPDTTIDRVVASEIALREGARAVIMPTVAEVGGRVRVSAEVVDPSTQTTVYAESADGVGAVSTLDSIDRVTHELRAKLGEALASIDEDSAPLPKVTSRNLDALRAYALAYKAYMRADFAAALGLYQQALSLDPEFSQAKVGIARLHIAGDNFAQARPLLTEALSHRDRLPAREVLYAEAFQAGLEYRPDYLERWKSLISLYPDFFPSYYNFALYATSYDTAYEEAAAVARGGLNQKNPGYGSVVYYLGLLDLAREDYAGAFQHLAQARRLDQEASRWLWAKAYSASGDHVRAEEAVLRFKRTGLPSNDVLEYLTAAAVRANRGRLGEAAGIIGTASREARNVGLLYERIYALAQASLAEFEEAPAAFEQRLRRLVAEEVRHTSGEFSDRTHAAFALAWASAAASRSGLTPLAGEARAQATISLSELNFPNATQMIAAADAQALIAKGESAAAVGALTNIDPERMLIAVRVTWIDALLRAGRLAEARRAAAGLARSRGRAFVESGSYGALQARNVVDSMLARLTEAQAASDQGDERGAAQALKVFDAEWPAADQPAAVASRRRALEPKQSR